MNIKLIGSDPEIFLTNGRRFISSIPLFGHADKETPLPMEKEGFFFLHDNVMVEMNPRPASLIEEFIDNTKYSLDYIRRVLPESLSISHEASAWFDEIELMDDRAKVFGCLPSFDAWNKGGERDRIENESNLRVAGGHIHYEVEGINYSSMISMIKALDLFLGVPSVMMDTDIHRRSLYGKAGDFREKLEDNRFEYRVLSNFWIFDEKLMEWVWNNSHKALEYIKTEGEIDDNSELAIDIQNCINNSDLSIADKLINKYNLEILTKEYV